jgi:hypothetical protein
MKMNQGKGKCKKEKKETPIRRALGVDELMNYRDSSRGSWQQWLIACFLRRTNVIV